MGLPSLVVALGAGILAMACRTAQPAATHASAAAAARGERSVFTDSALHAHQCVPPKAGENWRTICVPKDQRFEVRPKP